MGKPIYLGRVNLKWCDRCNVPLIGEKCDICGNKGRDVHVTPPGEVRIGFEGDLKILRDAINRQFGCNFKREMVLLNRVPHYDRMDEVIVDGKIVGNLRYDLKLKKYVFTLRMDGAHLLNSCAKKGWVVADKGAIKAVLSGKNLMLPGIIDFAENIEVGDEIIVRDESSNAVAVGIAKKTSEEMKNGGRGIGIKIRYAGYGSWKAGRDASIEDIVRANLTHLRNMERRAIEEIKSTVEKYNLPVAVSFSGGKDSLATLLLAMESGINFRVFFLDTGIELPETVEYVKNVERTYGIKIDTVSAGDAFWKNLKIFGPPGRDYRWCCKVCKLGPTVRYIIGNYPRGVLTLIGQRRYESFERKRKGKIWRNEWVPNQLSYSPIQNWTSMEVWLYILWKGAPVNPWYRRGLTRIGCYLCPSMDIGDMEIEKLYFEGITRWMNYLRDFAREHGVDERWAESSWRWKNPPPWAGGIRVEREKLKIAVEKIEEGGDLYLLRTNKPIDLSRARNLLFALPEGTYHIDSDGNVFVNGEVLKEAKSLVVRSQECVGCGICLARCPVNALWLDENKKIKINEEKCIHCLDCLGKCPAEEF